MSGEDAIEQIIGSFGRYQAWIFFLVTLGRFPAEIQLTNVVFVLPNTDYQCLDQGLLNVSNSCPCEDPLFDQSSIVSSVTSEWHLICGRGWLASLTQSILQVGILAGSLLYGFISDRYGRKLAVILALFTEALFASVSGLVPEFWMFIVCRFLIGSSLGGCMLCGYIILIEFSGKNIRAYVTGLIESIYIMAYLLLPIIAFYVREWRMLQLVTSVPWLLVISYFWLILESPRWLITVGKREEAIRVLTKIAKINNRPTDDIEQAVNAMEKVTKAEDEVVYGTYLDLFKTPRMRLYTFAMAFIWLCCAHTFFGINQYIGRLQGNLFLNVLLSAISLIPGLVIAVIISKYWKRKFVTIATFSLSAFSLLLFVFLPANPPWLGFTFAIIGSTAAYIAFVQVYLYTSEIFPTVIRNSAMGFASVFARFGGFIAPFVVNIGVEWASILIFSAVAFLAAILCLLLPETKDIVLPNTISQTNIKKDLPVT